MTAPARPFHISDILTVMTGRLVSPRHIEGIYDILGHLTGDTTLMTHQLPRASRDVEPYLRDTFPDLAAVIIPDTIHDEATLDAWLTIVVAEHGETRDVTPMPEGMYTHVSPFAEIVTAILGDEGARP